MTGSLPSVDRSRMQNMYQDRWLKHGASPASLGWTKGKQEIRFGVLLSGLDCEGKSFLDVGCGFGDLNAVLSQQCRHYDYHGIDIVPEFVHQGIARYGRDRVTFQSIDLFELPAIDRQFDFVIASGAFNYRLQEMDNVAYVEQGLAHMFRLCREAVSVDFLSDRVNYQQSHCFHSQPEAVLRAAPQLTRNVRLRHDYMPFEFAVTLFKDDSFDGIDTIFRRHKPEIADR